MDWSTWFQDVAGGVIDKAASAKFSQPYEIDKLRLQALGQTGYYEEGQAGTSAAPAGGLFGMSQGTTVLLIGGALLAFVLMKD